MCKWYGRPSSSKVCDAFRGSMAVSSVRSGGSGGIDVASMDRRKARLR